MSIRNVAVLTAVIFAAGISSSAKAQPTLFPTWQDGYRIVADDRFGLIPESDGWHVQGASSLISSITSNGRSSILITPRPTLGPNELRFRDASTGQPASWPVIPQLTNVSVPFGPNNEPITQQVNLNSVFSFITPKVDASGAISLLTSSQGTEGWAILIRSSGGEMVRRLNDFAPQFNVPVLVPTTLSTRAIDTHGRRHDNGRWAALVRLSTTVPGPTGLLGNLQEAPFGNGPVRAYLFKAGEVLTDGQMTLTTTDAFATSADLIPSPSWFFAEDGSMAVVTLATARQTLDQGESTGTVAILIRIDPRGERRLIARTKAPWESLTSPGFSNAKLVANFISAPAMNARGDIAFASSGGLLDATLPGGQRGQGVIIAQASENHQLRQIAQPGSSIWPGPTGPGLPPGVQVAQYTGLVTGTDVQIAESGDVYLAGNTVGNPGGLSIICWRAAESRLIRAIGFDEGLVNLPGWRTREVLFSPFIMAINRAGQLVTSTRLAGDTQPFSSQGFVGWDPSIGAQFLLPNTMPIRDSSGISRTLQAFPIISNPSYFQATGMGLTNRLSERGELVWRYTSSPGGVMTLSSRIRGQCGIADVGRSGGEGVADGQLDNNDFVAFIQAFFLQSTRADLGGDGGAAGADGEFDNNDFVVFVEAFFAGCP